jgi:predicted DCC family thiol-disulfide oxidoreductase YuxK
MQLDDSKVSHRIILFDGLCNLCNRFVDVVIHRDLGREFKIGALQSETGQKIMQEIGIPEEDPYSLILIDNGKIWTKSEAIFRIVQHLNGLRPIAYIFIMIPRILSDAAYDLIARNRYRLFGRSNTCRLPSPEERDRFI